jgi:hypothetical protein
VDTALCRIFQRFLEITIHNGIDMRKRSNDSDIISIEQNIREVGNDFHPPFFIPGTQNVLFINIPMICEGMQRLIL